MKRNDKAINYDSFKPYMDTFCTQLVVFYVLCKMKRPDIFCKLFKAWLKVCTFNPLPGENSKEEKSEENRA